MTITVLEMTPDVLKAAKAMAKSLGYGDNWAYTTHTIPGLYLAPSRPTQHGGVIVHAQGYGLMLWQDPEDLHLANEPMLRAAAQ